MQSFSQGGRGRDPNPLKTSCTPCKFNKSLQVFKKSPNIVEVDLSGSDFNIRVGSFGAVLFFWREGYLFQFPSPPIPRNRRNTPAGLAWPNSISSSISSALSLGSEEEYPYYLSTSKTILGKHMSLTFNVQTGALIYSGTLVINTFFHQQMLVASHFDISLGMLGDPQQFVA